MPHVISSAVLSVLLLSSAAMAQHADASNVARLGLGGYSPISYTSGSPKMGTPAHASVHEGVLYFFADAKEKKTFDRDPARFAPAYGGWCAYGAAIGQFLEVDPQSFVIQGGRLMLFKNPGAHEVKKAWTDGDERALEKKADAFWGREGAKKGATGAPVGALGYCPVAYVDAGKAIPGQAKYPAEHGGITYLFVNAGARERFQKSPEKYVPSYGGWCAYGMAKGSKVPVDPTNFKVVNGRLMLFFKGANKDTLELWNAGDAGDLTRKADGNWSRFTRS